MSRSVSLWLAIVASSLGVLFTPGWSVAEDKAAPLAAKSPANSLTAASSAAFN